MCGEHSVSATYWWVSPGSSPRVRGTPPIQLHRSAAGGIIPACAGNTIDSSLRVFLFRDHPRVCGEHTIWPPSLGGGAGSSPRVRGTHKEENAGIRQRGIIPACAGNTDRSRRMGWGERDHPRVCGEHWQDDSRGVRAMGSSPRVRGTQYSLIHVCFSLGIIPACAGNTALAEYVEIADSGSSPRVRGTHPRRCRAKHRSGIIPACAGNTHP